jgi:hypothetical protein
LFFYTYYYNNITPTVDDDTFLSRADIPGSVPILKQLKDQKILTGNFLDDRPIFLNISIKYVDVSLGTGYDSEYPEYSDSFNPASIEYEFGNDTIFSGKKISELKEYAFCIDAYDQRISGANSIDLSAPNLTKNIKSGGYTVYCSGN